MARVLMDQYIGKTGVDTRGIKWKVVGYDPSTMYRAPYQRAYIVIFNNHYKCTYSRDHFVKCDLGRDRTWETNILSKMTAYEMVGKEYETSNGFKFKVTEVVKSRPKYSLSFVKIKFTESGEECQCQVVSIVDNTLKYPDCLKDRMKDKITYETIYAGDNITARHGVGYCKFPEGVDEVQAPEGTIARWKAMLQRVVEASEDKSRAYLGVTVCDEWLNLYNFAVWSNENYVLNWDLDKDLLVPGNNEYRPDRCTFIPHVMNTVIINKPKIDGLPTGVYKNSSNTSKHVSPYCTEMGLFGKPIGYNVQTVMEGFVFYKLTKEFAIHEMAKRLFTSDSERDRKLLNAAEDYRVLDRRNDKENLITEEMVMDFLRKACGDTPDLKDRNYVYLKNLYMTRASLVFERKKRMIIEILDNEFVEEEDNYDYNF